MGEYYSKTRTGRPRQ